MKCFPALDESRVERDTRNGTHLDALRFIKVANALRTFARIDLVDLRAEKYRLVRALRLANVAVNAFVGNHQRHDSAIMVASGICVNL